MSLKSHKSRSLTIYGRHRGHVREVVLLLRDQMAQLPRLKLLGVLAEVLDDLADVLLRFIVVAERELAVRALARLVHAQRAVAKREAMAKSTRRCRSSSICRWRA
jgi:hypothetical protein